MMKTDPNTYYQFAVLNDTDDFNVLSEPAGPISSRNCPGKGDGQEKVVLPLSIAVKHSTEQDQITQAVVEKCVRIAVEALEGKRDRDGNALILHSLIVGSMGQTDAEKCAGFLHDVVEDTEWTLDDLKREGVPQEVLDVLELCTHEEGLSYEEYVQRIIDSGNLTAIHVKYNDLMHNLSRGKAFGYPKLIEKHSKALKKVTEALLKMVKKGE